MTFIVPSEFYRKRYPQGTRQLQNDRLRQTESWFWLETPRLLLSKH